MSENMRIMSCRHCQQIQLLPLDIGNAKPLCCRCRFSLKPHSYHNRDLVMALAFCALVLYLIAIFLPIMQMEFMGQRVQSSIVGGVMKLFATRQYLVGIVVLVFSLILPPLKLIALFVLATGILFQKVTQAWIHYFVELVGRWGMLDVLVIAVLVAFLKLGDVVQVKAGMGLYFFLLAVLFSLFAGFCIHLPALWDESR
ncbi:MAG TPA: paraquat-inducible protein A [Gemmatales bacterium]|nr:paraquat-inducible protein A [Gemmatales bacterium]